MINQHTFYYKSTLLDWPRGISFISVRMHKNSPNTVMITMTTMLLSHHDIDDGNLPLYIQQTMKCMRYTVNVKSKHCFVLFIIYHSPSALQKKRKYLRLQTVQKSKHLYSELMKVLSAISYHDSVSLLYMTTLQSYRWFFFHQNTFNTRWTELALPYTVLELTQLRHWVYRHKVLLYHFSTENSKKEECAGFQFKWPYNTSKNDVAKVSHTCYVLCADTLY